MTHEYSMRRFSVVHYNLSLHCSILFTMENNMKELIVNMKDELVIFHELTDHELDQILPYFKTVSCNKGSALFNEGDPSGFIAFILSGKLEIKKETEFEGKSMILGTLNTGSFVGETALVDPREPRAATAIALEDTKALTLNADALEAILNKYPETGVKILKELVKYISIRLLKALEKLAVVF